MGGSSSPGYSHSFVASIYSEHAHKPPYKKKQYHIAAYPYDSEGSNMASLSSQTNEKTWSDKEKRLHGLGVTSDKEEISRFYPTLNEQWMIEDTKRIKAPGVTRY